MRLLVTGREGQVVRSLVEKARTLPDVTVIPVGRPELDLARPGTVADALAGIDADAIVSAAAYTAVDRAEDEPELTMTINADGAGAVAAASAGKGVPVIHLSTDYVFPGTGDTPYEEDDEPDPQSAYGRSKLAGEKAVVVANPRHVILRTAWVYSPFGGNFVKTMLRFAGERDEIRVVSDQRGNPTSALDIADGIIHVARRMAESPSDMSCYGVFHLAGSGSTSWSGFAEEIMASSRAGGGPSARIVPITTEDYPTKARRPANSRLATDKLEAVFGWRAPDWRRSARDIVTRLHTEVLPLRGRR